MNLNHSLVVWFALASLTLLREAGALEPNNAARANPDNAIGVDLIDEPMPESGFLGAYLADADNDGVKGAAIASVMKGSAAENFGLEVKDVILAIGAVEVSTATSLSNEIKKFRAGAKTTVTLLRNGKKLVVDLTLGSRPKFAALTQHKPPRVSGATMEFSGIITGSLSWGGNLILADGVGTIGEDLELSWESLMEVDLDHEGALSVKGDVSIAGILHVVLKEKNPRSGDRFEIIRDASSIKGEFGLLMLPRLQADLHWDIVYDSIAKGIDVDGDKVHDVTLIVRSIEKK
ncbi:MAG: PDZ domain-containing protein [Planctomycetaceae bacterium]|nr:PDZ domain-containing protein [Planctomycetaceae bacterium]